MMANSRFLSGILSLLVLVSGATAGTLTAEQQLFLKAEKAAKQGDRAAYRQLREGLGSYPLVPYLEYQNLERRLATASTSDVAEFLESNAETPLAWRLRYRWLSVLAQQGRWDDFLRFYQPDFSTTLDCRYRVALINRERNAEALQNVEHIWLTGHSQPDACDAVFSEWRKTGGMTSDLVWQRIQLAMSNANVRLARYLRRFLPAAERTWVDLWIEVHNEPAAMLRSAELTQDHPTRNTIIAHGLRRWVWRDAGAAVAAWDRLKNTFTFSLEERGQIHSYLGMALAKQRRPEALTWLTSVDPSHESEDVRTWRVRMALHNRDWSTALAAIGWLSEDEKQSHRWQYWRGRSLEALGFQAEADAVYRELARQRDYHGFLAAERLKLPYQFQDRPLAYSAEQLQEMEQIAGIARARELYALDRALDARREWEYASRQLDEEQLRKAAKLAQQWGWYSRAIVTAAQSQYWDDVEMRFPLGFQQEVLEQASAQSIDPAWVYGIVRQESAFMHDARSPAGAMGLMQLMPSTGHYVARRLKTRLSNSWQLLDVGKNITLGSAYLRDVRDRLFDHPVLATAAYNAGYTRVKRWLPENYTVDADLWVETIPFDETRDYLERVLAYTMIYQWRLTAEQPSLAGYMRPVSSLDGMLSRSRADDGGGA